MNQTTDLLDVLTTLTLLDVCPVDDIDDIPPRWQPFHSIPCKASPDGWAEFSQPRATPQELLLCVHCGEAHKEVSS
jgi:hypothetical protein